MKIRRFTGVGINGFLDLDVNFNEDLTFVTGINGSGKTTVLNAVISLLMPRLDFLTQENYQYLSIEIEHNGKERSISSDRLENGASIYIDGKKSSRLLVHSLLWDESYPPSRNREMEQAYFKEQISRNSSHPVIEYIQSLPTPMYLGLDRRITSIDQEFQSKSTSFTRNTIGRRNVFSQPLSQSLLEALGFAFENYRAAQRKKTDLDEDFRRELVLDLIGFSPEDVNSELRYPSTSDFKNIEIAKENINKLPGLLNIPEVRVLDKVRPLFDFFDNTRKIIDKHKKSSPPMEDEVSAIFGWNFNQSHLSKIVSLSKRISDYNESVSSLFRESDSFLQSVRHFLSDSGKLIIFNNFGELNFITNANTYNSDLKYLSSGEVQIVVILAHLHFNPALRRAGIFLIDEPELSLHVEWQEKFVSTLLSSNVNTQFIMATHSPSIILDRVNKCVDITPKVAR